jgi:hypothetical protein
MIKERLFLKVLKRELCTKLLRSLHRVEDKIYSRRHKTIVIQKLAHHNALHYLLRSLLMMTR